MVSQFGLYVLLGVVAVAIVGGAVLSVVLSRDNRLKRRIRGATPLAIATARPGETVRISGTIETADELLHAPMTGRACVYYLAVLEIYRSSGRSGRWDEIVREERSVAFDVRDATGAVRVHMYGAEVAVVRDHHTQSGTFDDPNAIEAGFLARHNLEATTLLGFNKSYRYMEGALEPGEAVGVLGTLHETAGARSLQGGLAGPLLVSDDPSTLAPRS